MSPDRIEFEAADYHADGHFSSSHYAFTGSTHSGWRIDRNGAPHLELGSGYQALRTLVCGVCSTDLDRRFLPFPLPQVTGHELVGVDAEGRRQVVEINASCRARDLQDVCAFCRAGYAHHCPTRLVLGIHDLPGGFGPWHLAPTRAVLPVPDALPTLTAVLIEPFAAALHAARIVAPRSGDRVAVLGPRRLGMLVIAALAGLRTRTGVDFEIVALPRRAELADLARSLGADDVRRVGDAGEDLPAPYADIVIDTTGSPEGLRTATRLARRELHLKSTHGRPAVGLEHLTELVVDEIAVGRLPAGEARGPAGGRLVWLCDADVPADLEARFEVERSDDPRRAFAAFADAPDATGLPGAAVAVVDRAGMLDAVIRPDPSIARSLVRPLGEIWIHGRTDSASSELVEAIATRDLRLSTSRCGDFREALDLLCSSAALRGLGERFVTDRLPASQIAGAFERASSPESIKVVVEHPVPAP